MSEDIFKYRSVTEWNGYIVDFDMPSTDGDMRLTELCLDSDSCLEATKYAIELSWINSEFALARSSPVLKIIRTLFGGDGDEPVTYPLIVDGVYHIMGPPTEFAVEFSSVGWELDIVHADAFDLSIDIVNREQQTEIGTYEWWQPFVGSGLYIESSIGVRRETVKYSYVNRMAHNPRWKEYYSATETHPAYYDVGGSLNDPFFDDAPTNWDTNGDRYMSIQWKGISEDTYCTSLIIPNRPDVCETTPRGGFCRQSDFNEPLVISNKNTGRCSNNDLKTKILCEEEGYIWTTRPIPYSNKELSFPATDEAFKLNPIERLYCEGVNLDPDWPVYTAETAEYYNNNYQFEFIDIETPLGFVPGTAIITAINIRGDFGYFYEVIDIGIGMGNTWEFGRNAENVNFGGWRKDKFKIFDYFVLSGLGSQPSELTTYQGKVGFWASYAPDPEVGETNPYCADSNGVPMPENSTLNTSESGCLSTWAWDPLNEIAGGPTNQWLDTPWWQVQYEIRAVPEVGVFENWSNGGKCLVTNDYWAGGAGANWRQETGFTSRSMCMETSQTMAQWDTFYLMWIEDTNYWTTLYHNWVGSHGGKPQIGMDSSAKWFPPGGLPWSHGSAPFCNGASGTIFDEVSCTNAGFEWYDYGPGNYWGGGLPTIRENLAAGNTYIDGTKNYHTNYNLLTAKTHREYPKKHKEIHLEPILPYTADDSWTMYASETWMNWGNASEVHRASFPIWITNTFSWPDPERGYDYCQEMNTVTSNVNVGENPRSEWSLPVHDDVALGGNFQGEACWNSGVCTRNSDGAVLPQYANDEAGCMSVYGCTQRNDGYSYYGSPAVDDMTCYGSGHKNYHYNHIEESIGQPAQGDPWSYPPSPDHCWYGSTATRPDGTYGQVYNHIACGNQGLCNQNGGDCWNQNYGNANGGAGGYYFTGWGNGSYGSSFNAVHCANGKWTTQSRCENQGVCMQQWFYTGGGSQGNTWINRSGFTPGSYTNPASNNEGWCNALHSGFDSWCQSASYCSSVSTVFTSSNNTWDNFGGPWGSPYPWGRLNTWTWSYYWWWKSYPKVEVEQAIDIDHPSVDRQYQMLTWQSHPFVADLASPPDGWCSDDGTVTGNLVLRSQWLPFAPPGLGGNPVGLYGCQQAGECTSNQNWTGVGGQENCANEGYCEAGVDAQGNVIPEAAAAVGNYVNFHYGTSWQWNTMFSHYCEERGTCFDVNGAPFTPYDAVQNGNEYSCITDPLNGSPQNTWLAHNNTWITATDPDNTGWNIGNTTFLNYGWDWQYPQDHFASEPTAEIGLHTPDRPEGATIRWKAPEAFIDVTQRLYTRPSFYRIYRSKWVSPEGLSLTGSDYEAGMWSFAGEVPAVSEHDFHTFLDTRADLVGVGVGPYDRVYYRITAVWEDWNWKAGWKEDVFGGQGCGPNYLTGQNWDYHWDQTWSHFAPVGTEDEDGAIERLDGICSQAGTNNDYEVGCLAEGDCIGVMGWEGAVYDNDELGCLGQGTCTDATYNNDEPGCTSWPVGTCSETSIADRPTCEALGTCSRPPYNNDSVGCASAGHCTDTQGILDLSDGDDDFMYCSWLGSCDTEPEIWQDQMMCEMMNQYTWIPATWTPATWTQVGVWAPATWTTPFTCSHSLWDGDEPGCLAEGACTDNIFNNDEPGCLASGTCSDATYNNDEPGCLGAGGSCSELWWGGGTITQEYLCAMAGTCNGSQSWWPQSCLDVGTCANIGTGIAVPQFDDDPYSCHHANGTCSDASITSGGSCIASGTCSDPADGTAYPQWDNDRYACVGAFGGDFSEPFWPRGWSWWNPTNTWTPDNEFTSTQTWITTGVWSNPTWTSAGNTWTTAGNTWNGPSWNSAGNTWTDGNWTGMTGANFDSIESTSSWNALSGVHNSGFNNANIIKLGYELKNAMSLWHPIDGDEFSQLNDGTNTVRYSGWFRAPATGEYKFKISSYDSSYIWIGTAGQLIERPDTSGTATLVETRDHTNYIAACPGKHGNFNSIGSCNNWAFADGTPNEADCTSNGYSWTANPYPHKQFHVGRISLVAGEIYPVLAYFTSWSQAQCQSFEMFEPWWNLRIHYPDGDWNEGGNGSGVWGTGTFDTLPGMLSTTVPHSGINNDGSTFVQPSLNGQTVEGKFTNEQEGSVYFSQAGEPIYSFYTQ